MTTEQALAEADKGMVRPIDRTFSEFLDLKEEAVRHLAARVRELEAERAKGLESFIRNCIVIPRTDGVGVPMFVAVGEGDTYLTPHLDGYAIVPRDQWEYVARFLPRKKVEAK